MWPILISILRPICTSRQYAWPAENKFLFKIIDVVLMTNQKKHPVYLIRILPFRIQLFTRWSLQPILINWWKGESSKEFHLETWWLTYWYIGYRIWLGTKAWQLIKSFESVKHIYTVSTFYLYGVPWFRPPGQFAPHGNIYRTEMQSRLLRTMNI